RLAPGAGSGQSPQLVTTLPADILPGNILGIGADGLSVNCLRVLPGQPLSTIQIKFDGRVLGQVQPLFATARFGSSLSPLARSADGAVLVMSQVTATRGDLAAEGISGVPQQETLIVADASTGANQRLTLPAGGQLVQAFWSPHVPPEQIRAVPQAVMQQ